MFLASPALAQKTTVQVKIPKSAAKHKAALRKLQQEQSGTTARVWLQQKEAERIKRETERLRYMVMKDRLRLYNQAARRYRWKTSRKPRKKRHQPYWQEWKYLKAQVSKYEKRHRHSHLPWFQQKAIEYGIMDAPKRTEPHTVKVRKVVRRAKKVSKPLAPPRPKKKITAPPRPGVQK